MAMELLRVGVGNELTAGISRDSSRDSKGMEARHMALQQPYQ